MADPNWPTNFYPFASAIDTPLPRPEEHTELMTRYAEPWAAIAQGGNVNSFELYPDEGIEDWHKIRGLYAD